MSRGIGMQTDEEQVGVKTTGIGTGQVRGFSTDLPAFSNGAAIQAGQKIQNLGEQLQQIAGQQSAVKAATEAEIEKDPVTGQYKRPEAPWAGILTRQTYDQIIDKRTIEQVVSDFEGQADKIAADYFNRPAEAEALFRKLHESTLKALPDQRLANLVQPHLDREVNQRQRGILSLTARQNWGNEVDYTREAESQASERALGLLQIGDTAGAAAAYQTAEDARARRVALNADDPRSLDLADQRWKSVQNGALLLNRVEHELETNPERIPDTIRRLHAMLRGGGSDEDEVLGFTKQSLMTRIGSQKERDALAARLNSTLQDYMVRAESRKNTRDPADYEAHYLATGRSGRNYDWSSAQEGELVQGYMRAKGLDPYKGETVEHLWRLTGAVPESYYKPLFTRAITKSPVQLARLADVYNTMQTLKDPAGNPVGAGAAILNDDDAAYMRVFSEALRDAPADSRKAPEDQLQERALFAKKEADALFKAGADKLKDVTGTSGYAGVINKAREETGLPKFETDKMVADIRSHVDPWGPGEGGMRELSAENLQELTRSIAGRMAKGNATYEQARDEAITRFRNTHSQSDLILVPGTNKGGGWVRNEYGVPMLDDLAKGGGNAKTDRWLKPYVDGIFKLTTKGEILDETKSGKDAELMIPRQQLGQKIENPELGKNLFLVPRGVSSENQQFGLVYKNGDGSLIPLTTVTGRDVLLRVGGEAKRQQAEIAKRFKDPEYRRTQEERAQAIVGAGLGGPAGGLAVRIPEEASRAPAPVDPVKILDPVMYGDTTEPNLQQTQNGPNGGRRGRTLDYPRRRDGLTDPMQDLGDTTTGLGHPGYNGYGRPGIDAPTQLVSARRDENTRFRVTNQSGPQAGQTVTIHPEFGAALAQMLAAMPTEIRDGFRLGSVVRSYDQQVEARRTAVAKHGHAAAGSWAATPGRSPHEHGVAADIAFGSPEARAWVHANAQRFGLKFPMPWEPWHIEPIWTRGGALTVARRTP